ncbi:hypothetical protein AWH48_00750 [Domibacillus aminovorans]|uniref:Diguanylate cyclase n=1 Tax=Domibacillus aminovorans TaxID=29332 RepID=A0A177L2W2_9BACI|nr:EAL domain-containing protein [Domibacillus aminovorans]OAH59667.1 hypothetical protein AWH48_00750 [Domibacillus aminovorans]
MTTLLRQPVMVFIIAIIMLSYIWIYFFQNDEIIRETGVFALQLIGVSVSFIWVYQTYDSLKKEKDKESNFWLLIGIGMVPYGVAWLISGYYHLLLRTNAPYPGFDDYLWILAYLIWIIALIYKLKLVLKKTEITRFIFDISIFMIVIISLIWELLLSNVFLNLSGNFLTDAIGIAYPVIDLTLLFVTILLYFTTRNNVRKTIFTFISIGFTFQIIADFIYVYQSLNGSYIIGGWINPLWNLTLLLKGAAGLYILHIKKSSIHEEGYFTKIKHHDILSYILLLSFLIYMFCYSFDHFVFIEYAFFTVIFMVITRQVIVLFQKETALEELNALSKSLEKQVENKTQELQNALNKVNKMAKYDNLTGLPNRYMLNECLDETIERCKQNNKELAIMFLDLDRFKIVNDTMGHHTGDLLLIEVSKRLRRSVREDDIVARQGGDEFIILLEDIDKDSVAQVAQRIIDEFVPPFTLNNKEFFTTTSIGISIFPNDGQNQVDIIKSADKAMYLAKERGKNNYQFYRVVSDTVNRKMMLEEGLRRAIEESELYLHYQPQIDLKTSEMVGIEALLRWDHPELGKVSPNEFIPIAEETGLIIPIGEWVLRAACKQNKTWQVEGYPPIKVAVNVSTYQLRSRDFLEYVKQVLQETGLQPEFLELEITESLMQNLMETRIIINKLKKIGVNIAIDDFGTGYSSLSVLNHLPIDVIKIDRTFINDMLTNSNTSALVKTMIEMGKNLNIKLVAEGIESEEQRIVLKDLKCQIGQGYLFSLPIPVEEMEKLLNM